MKKELRINYNGMELRIKSKNLGRNFDNDFEMYRLNGKERTLLMTYRERWDEIGYRVEVFSEGILKRHEIERMLHTLLPLTTLVENVTLTIHE